MLGELQKLLRRDQDAMPAAVWRHKRSYKKWDCGNCKHTYFYGVIKCPVCESREIKQTIHQLDDYKDVVL